MSKNFKNIIAADTWSWGRYQFDESQRAILTNFLAAEAVTVPEFGQLWINSSDLEISFRSELGGGLWRPIGHLEEAFGIFPKDGRLAMGRNLSLSNFNIKNLKSPVNDKDGATRKFVEEFVGIEHGTYEGNASNPRTISLSQANLIIKHFILVNAESTGTNPSQMKTDDFSDANARQLGGIFSTGSIIDISTVGEFTIDDANLNLSGISYSYWVVGDLQ